MSSQIEAFKDYFDVIEASNEAKIEWEGNIVTVTLKNEFSDKLVRRSNAEDAELYKFSGSELADSLYKEMLDDFSLEKRCNEGRLLL